ncbi:LexA family protein [Enteroscipio rubneri]|nr:XRE family transcriptional regulator [Enteroscipio rubneri]
MKPLSEAEIQDVLIENLKALMSFENVSQAEIARRSSIEKQTVSSWMRGVSFPSARNIKSLTEAFGLTTDDLLSNECGLASRRGKERPIREYEYAVMSTMAPVYGRIAAGDPLEMMVDHDEVAYLHPDVAQRHPDGFFLTVSGDSMDKIMPDGSLAFVDPRAAVANGDVAAITVNGDDATIKRIFFAGDTVVLHPESSNPAHRDRAIDSNDPDAPAVRIIGKVVWHYLVDDDRL